MTDNVLKQKGIVPWDRMHKNPILEEKVKLQSGRVCIGSRTKSIDGRRLPREGKQSQRQER